MSTVLVGCSVAAVLVAGGCARVATEANASPISATSATSTSATAPTSDPTSSVPPSPDAPLAGRTIVIDPGHTGGWTKKWGYHKVPNGHGGTKACNSSGTATNRGYAEHAYNFAQAQALATALRAQGATVLLTRTDDRTASNKLCVNHRADLLNNTPADLLISLHADGNLGKKHRGFHVIVSTVMKGGAGVISASKTLATDVRNALQTQTSMPRSNYIGHGTAYSFRSDLGTLNFARHPAVMIEMGNMRNATDARLFTSPSFRTQAAAAITSAVVTFLS
ncbi:MAG: N-acetylmuramoyl-L-alanine amidase [Propionibacteriales bacterium]|nr:N-acetylmuramoyl-L-alanine amidase [Propionibacteriales bacterium]